MDMYGAARVLGANLCFAVANCFHVVCPQWSHRVWRFDLWSGAAALARASAKWVPSNPSTHTLSHSSPLEAQHVPAMIPSHMTCGNNRKCMFFRTITFLKEGEQLWSTLSCIEGVEPAFHCLRATWIAQRGMALCPKDSATLKALALTPKETELYNFFLIYIVHLDIEQVHNNLAPQIAEEFLVVESSKGN